jgi:enediyne biosynthesis protein E4
MGRDPGHGRPGPGIRREHRGAAARPAPGPRGKTLFTIVPPEESGLRTENNYDDPEIWGRLSREFDLGAVGTGVAIGDYDNDGLPDIFVVSKTGSCRLFHNLGNWKFEDVTEKAGVGDHGAAARIWKQGATFVDVNNDGLLDIYVCRFNAPNLLYINQGDGTFKEEAHAYGLDVTDGSVMAYFCDYDRDGWLDVFIQTNVLDAAAHPEGQRSYLFHNNGNGTFTDVTDRAGVAPGGRMGTRRSGGTSTATAGRTCMSRTTSTFPMRFTATTATARSRTSSPASCRTRPIRRWARTSAT